MKIYADYEEDLFEFRRAMAEILADNHEEKGNTWTFMDESSLREKLLVKAKKLNNDIFLPVTYLHIANYCYMLWERSNMNKVTEKVTNRRYNEFLREAIGTVIYGTAKIYDENADEVFLEVLEILKTIHSPKELFEGEA